MKYYAIIVAGGSGSRMNSDVPKQFLLLNSKPVLMHTIEAFNRSVLSPEIVLTLNPQYFSFWQDLCKQHNFTIPHKIVSSGEHRFHSVKNGLDLVENGSITAIHDGVRPIVSADLITRTFHLAEQKKAVIPVIMSKDSVRMKTGEKSVVLKREDILLVQTPQTFQSTLLKSAYLQQFDTNFTDDASVVEALGKEVFTTEGDYMNIKITYPEDLQMAELFLKNQA